MNLDPKILADKAWKYISPRVPESQELLNHAKSVGANQTNTTPVMEAIEKFLASRGKGGVLENNLVWNSCKGKNPQELLPHLKKCGMQSGKLDILLKLIGGGN